MLKLLMNLIHQEDKGGTSLIGAHHKLQIKVDLIFHQFVLQKVI